MTRTLKELAQEAIDIQNGCNLTGLVHGFSRAMTELRQLCPNQGTDFYNQHYISRLWASKIADLSGCEYTYLESYNGCEILAKS